MSYDAIVIGAGHNGLVCAAYLARAGMSVLVLERRAELGGMAGTHELLRGVRVPTLAHTVGRLRPSIARELGLRGHGLAMVQPEVRVFALQPDGRALTLRGDVDRTTRDLAESGLVDVRDAESYATVDEQVRALGRGLAELMGRVPPDLASPTLGDAFAGLRTGLAARARARSANGSLMRAMPMAVRDLVAEWFESDALRAAVAARGMLYSGLSPRMPGSGGVLLTDLAGNDGGLAGQAVFARGGPGAVTNALAAAAQAHGAEIRSGAAVVHVRRDNDRVAGVTLAGGEEIDAPVVVSTLDPRTTLLDLLEPEVLGPRLSWRASNIRQRGTTAKVNLALSGLPDFKAAGGDARRLRGRILIAPSMRYLDLAARPAKYGQVPQQPLLEATIPTLVDPGLLADGRRGRARTVAHVMSVVVEGVPPAPAGGTWDQRREALGDAVVAALAEYASGFAELIVERQIVTPLDIERDYGAAGGHAMHAEVTLDQWFAWRPMHGLGRYRMPLGGMYLAGSGAHPGGGVTGSPGQLAAQAVIADGRPGRRRVDA